MKFVLTGAAGNISHPLAETLLSAGHDVTVIGRNAENLKSLTDKGATAAIGSVEDVAFLTETFHDADGVYTMVPPNFAASDWKDYIGNVGKGYAEAIRLSGVQYVVNLSSIGADQPEGTGPVTGLYRVEQALDALENVNVLHVRAGYFYNNLYGNIGMIKGAGIIGGNYDADIKIPMVDPQDIAETIASALQALDFKGKQVRYIVSDLRTASDVAQVLGKAIGKPELPWVAFSDDQSIEGMKGAGLPEEIAKNYTEMGVAMRAGKMQQHFLGTGAPVKGKHKLEHFAQNFAGAYSAS